MCWISWEVLDEFIAGRFEVSWGVFGCVSGIDWGPLRDDFGHLGGILEAFCRSLGLFGGLLGASRGPLGLSWAPLGTS